jgi:nicotinamidase-related amidase
MITLDARRTALVLIDLQNGIVGLSLAPRSGSDVVATASGLARTFRAAGAPVVLVRVGWAGDFADALKQPVDQPLQRPVGGFPAGWSDLVAGLAAEGDLHVTKRQWGAFYGTDLDLQLRRRGMTTIVLAGIATNFGVESTARDAWELGYAVVLAEDATTSVSGPLHEMAVGSIFPRIARVTQSRDIALAEAR